MSPEKQRKIAGDGGRIAHEAGRAHEFTQDEARAAGRKGGIAVSQNKDYMKEIGRRGGLARAKQRRNKEEAAGRGDGSQIERVGPDLQGRGRD